LIKRLYIAAGILLAVGSTAPAQSIDELNIQVHGYVTQGFVYTSQNNWNTTESSDGSAAWNDAVLNVSAQPDSRLHIGVQGRYSLLGSLGNQITLDWAQVDYKANDYFGVRVGKVKSPLGLYNETQDIDPALLWILLPQSIYPLASRNATLAHYGGVVYGTLPLGGRMGKLQYWAFAGQRVVAADDGYFQPERDEGLSAPNGVSGRFGGGMLRWKTPVRGLMIGASEQSGGSSGPIAAGPYMGKLVPLQLRQPIYFATYEESRLTVSSEFSRVQYDVALEFPGAPDTHIRGDQRLYYVMASYKATGKLSGGLYFSSSTDHRAAFTSGRYQKDWDVSGRYDFNSFVYAKVEQHWIDGTAIGFSTSDNANLKPTTKMTLLKIGVSF
jgi:hypothetical protein